MIEKLIELHSKATPGPWAAHKEEYDSHEAMATDTGKAYARGGHVLHYLVAGDKLFPAFTGNGPTSMVNAEYLATAHDAMPALLQLAKAVGEYIEINQTHLDPEEKFLAMCEAFDALTTNRAPCNCESKGGGHHGDCASNDPQGAA